MCKYWVSLEKICKIYKTSLSGKDCDKYYYVDHLKKFHEYCKFYVQGNSMHAFYRKKILVTTN